jgi:hypothetical protein
LISQPAQALDARQTLRARNMLVQTVRTRLKGTGLDIRELASELVISYPGHPERGRIYITYATGEVSLRLTVWTYLGPLEGFEPNDDPDREPAVDADKIIATLTGEPVVEGTTN